MLSTTILVGNPFAGFTQVVEVEHGRNRIDTQTIDMIFSEPEQGIGYEKIAHFTATIVKDVGTPFLVFPFARIGIFIEVSAVKVTQGVPILGEMRGHPVEKNADTL